LQVYKLSGPTLFAPVIKMACAIAQQPTAHLRYLVLLILTDGAIMDMEVRGACQPSGVGFIPAV
jgi:hypothetical protein